MNWETHAVRLAEDVSRPTSRWRGPVATTPRHLFVPRWWNTSRRGWSVSDGPSEATAWLDTAYSDTSLVTRVGPLHADHATPDDHPSGRPTSSSTLPSLVVRMFQHTDIYDEASVLDIGIGSGYGAALLARRLGDKQITSIDVDPYLATVAAERLDHLGLHPTIVMCDATGPLPEEYDRIVATVSVRPIPESWLTALKPGGRLVTTIAGTTIIIVADKTEDGGAVGRVQWDRAGFMTARNGDDYPHNLREMFDQVRDLDGDEVGQGRYPVVQVIEAWELQSVLEVFAPDIEHRFEEGDDGRRTAWMLHADGSWARATAMFDKVPTVHQSGPRRLWDILDQIRHQWLVDGSLPLYGAHVFIQPSGQILLARGNWRGRIA